MPAGRARCGAQLIRSTPGGIAERDSIAGQMQRMLLGAEFRGRPVAVARARSLIRQAASLLAEARLLPP